MASARIKHLALILVAYQYTIKHQAGTRMTNADVLIKLPPSETPTLTSLPGDFSHILNHLNENDYWQVLQDCTFVLISESIPGHHTCERANIFILAIPVCVS